MKTIYDFIIESKTKYEKPIRLDEGWDWSMKEHLRRSFLYWNSQFEEHNENRNLRPFKNIILPILNIHFRTEGFDVKDIQLYVENKDEHYKSFVINKFHNKWALKNFMDTFIDDIVVSYCVYGGTLARDTDEERPDVIDLRTLAFCNQTNILDYPFAIKHTFSPAQLRKMKGWGEDSNGATIDVESLITIAKKEDEDKEDIEIYEVHGLMPVEWLSDEPDVEDSEKDVQQIQVVAFYQDENKQETGVTLFKHKEPTLPFKYLARDKVDGRALGRGAIEELFEQQVWTNWDEVKITEMLDSAAKTLLWSDDPTFKAKNKLDDVDNNEVLVLQEGKKIQQLDTYPRNLQPFVQSLGRLQQQAQLIGSASEGLLGEEPASGTPFKLYEAQNIEARGMHKYRQGQIAVFMDEIYRDWVLPHLAREITKEQYFMSILSVDELQEVADKLVENEANKLTKKRILGMQTIFKEEVEMTKEIVKNTFLKKGNKRFLEIFKDEMKDISLSVMTNIKGKQKNLGLLTDKLVNVLRQYIASPQIRADKGMNELLNTILESSDLSPIMFNPPALPAPQPRQAQPQPEMMPK